MSHASLSFLAALLLASLPAAMGAGAAVSPDDQHELSRKLLQDALAHVDDIQNPGEHSSVMQAIGLAFVEAGDEDQARKIDEKVQSTEVPRPIPKAIALQQLRTGQISAAISTARIMKDQDGSDLTFMAMAEQADNAGDPEMAARLCAMATGPLRLDALLLSARIQAVAADEEGSADSLNAAKVLAVRQPAVAKVAETEALLGNLEHAQRLMGRLRREHDRSKVYAAMVYIEAAAKDFDNASAHADEIYEDELKANAIGRIAMAHAEMGQIKQAADAIDSISDWDARLNFQLALTTLELNRHGIPAGLAIASATKDVAKMVCLSQVAAAASRAADARQAQALLEEIKAGIAQPHPYMPDESIETIVENLSRINKPNDAMEVAGHIRDSVRRSAAISQIIRATVRADGLAAAQKLLDSITDPLGREFGLLGLAEGNLDSRDDIAKAK